MEVEINNSSTESSVFIVECSTGCHDFKWWIGGIFTDINLANELRDKLNEEAMRIKSACPIRNEDDENSEDIYWKYYISNEKYMEWNNAVVKEYSLNKPINNII